MSKIVELFSFPVKEKNKTWQKIIQDQFCPYTKKKCFKVRKSQPDISIGTCVVEYGRKPENIIICPNRLLQNNQIFLDCIHLLTLHQPGNELHIIPEVSIPGGNVDYFLVSTNAQRKIVDFIGIELQTMDTTGSVWPERELALYELNALQNKPNVVKSFGMNWKMTAKTILVQLHHKIQTFQSLNKHLVLVVQDPLIEYIQREFSFSHICTDARLGDSMQFHSYSYDIGFGVNKIRLRHRYSTDQAGIATLLGLKANANVKLEEVIAILETKISDITMLRIGDS